MSLQQVIEAALALPEEDRTFLVERIQDSLESPNGPRLRPEWMAEIQRRSDEIDQGKVKLLPWDEVKRELNKRFGGDDNA